VQIPDIKFHQNPFSSFGDETQGKTNTAPELCIPFNLLVQRLHKSGLALSFSHMSLIFQELFYPQCYCSALILEIHVFMLPRKYSLTFMLHLYSVQI
jgi:hypothetical protein